MFKKGEIATIITLFGLGVMLVGLTAGSFLVNRNEPLKTFSRATEPSATPTPFNGANCVDSDGGNNPERAGSVTTTVSSFGGNRVVDFFDTCTQGYDGRKVLREYYCLGDQVKTADQLCVNNCQEGGQGDYCSSSVVPTSLPSNRATNGTLSVSARNVTANGGTIDVTLRLPGIASAPTLSRAYYHVSVNGTGVSISPSSQEDLFGSGSAEEKTKSFLLTMDQLYRAQNCPTFTVVARAEYYDTDGLLQTVSPVTFNGIPPDNRNGCIPPPTATPTNTPILTNTIAPSPTTTVGGVTPQVSPSTAAPSPTVDPRACPENDGHRCMSACSPSSKFVPALGKSCSADAFGAARVCCQVLTPTATVEPTSPFARRSPTPVIPRVSILPGNSPTPNLSAECRDISNRLSAAFGSSCTSTNYDNVVDFNNSGTIDGADRSIFSQYQNDSIWCSQRTVLVATYCSVILARTPTPVRLPTTAVPACTPDGYNPPNGDASRCCSTNNTRNCAGGVCIVVCGAGPTLRPSATPTRPISCPRLSELMAVDYVQDNVLNAQDFLAALNAFRNRTQGVSALSTSLLLANLGTNLETAAAGCPALTPRMP